MNLNLTPALLFPYLALVLSSIGANALPAQTESTGSLTGFVSNAATGNFLEGVTVELPQLGIVLLTDNTGRYRLSQIPVGTHDLTVSYLGLDTVRDRLTISPGQEVRRDFELRTDLYTLPEFKVTGEREGTAAAITAQRNAPNLKNVVSTDSFANLPHMSATEIALRLAGVAGNFSDDDIVAQVSIRGMGPGLNVITVDGSLLTSEGGMNRNTRMYNITGAMFEQLELIKGHTPDKGADSLGGTINLKSRSSLNMKEKRRLTYNVSARYAPPFTEQIPLREEHRLHPRINWGYQEIFSLWGGDRNLGVAVNLHYGENAVGLFTTQREFQNTPVDPAYVWDYRTVDLYNNRKQASASVKVEYRLSAATRFTLNTVLGNDIHNYQRRYEVRAFAAQTVGTSGNAGILPGYTNEVTQVRAAPGSSIDVTNVGPNNFYQRRRHFEFGGEHQWGPWLIDYNANYSQANLNEGSGQGGTLVNRISNVGWILDRSASDLHPRFIQTEGPDFTDPANYRPTGFLSHNDRGTANRVRDFRANVQYRLPVRPTIHAKAGAQRRQQTVGLKANLLRWSYLGAEALPADPQVTTFDTVKTGRAIPIWQTSTIINRHRPVNPELWNEDRYFHEQNKYTGTREASETVTSGYVMMQGKIRSTGFLAGVRTERTETAGRGWVRARRASSPAEQVADPVGAARRDYADTYRELAGDYTKSFPSIHLAQDFRSGFKGRASWSTSFGRPAMTHFLPNETPNENAQILTINNPSLLPQMAENWDLSLEYYFEPVGSLSLGWFHKTIENYIVSGIDVGIVPEGADNGFDGEYAGFTMRSSRNAGTATVRGWELSYQQQYSFLPGLLKGLSSMVSYTLLDTHGDFGGTANLSSGQVAGFRPRTANFSLFWRYRSFSAQALINYHARYLTSYSAVAPHQNLYQDERTLVNVSFAYQLRPGLSLTCDVANIFDEPQVFYRGTPERMQRTNLNGTTITVGIGGRF